MEVKHGARGSKMLIKSKSEMKLLRNVKEFTRLDERKYFIR
jgi:hypothetical protein